MCLHISLGTRRELLPAAFICRNLAWQLPSASRCVRCLHRSVHVLCSTFQIWLPLHVHSGGKEGGGLQELPILPPFYCAPLRP